MHWALCTQHFACLAMPTVIFTSVLLILVIATQQCLHAGDYLLDAQGIIIAS